MIEDKSEVLPQMRKTLAHNLGTLLALAKISSFLAPKQYRRINDLRDVRYWFSSKSRSLSAVTPIAGKMLQRRVCPLSAITDHQPISLGAKNKDRQ